MIPLLAAELRGPATGNRRSGAGATAGPRPGSPTIVNFVTIIVIAGGRAPGLCPPAAAQGAGAPQASGHDHPSWRVSSGALPPATAQGAGTTAGPRPGSPCWRASSGALPPATAQGAGITAGHRPGSPCWRASSGALPHRHRQPPLGRRGHRRPPAGIPYYRELCDHYRDSWRASSGALPTGCRPGCRGAAGLRP